MAKSWYYAEEDGHHNGPVDSKTLKRLAADGVIQATTLIQREGSKKSAKAGAVKGLFEVPVEKPESLPELPQPENIEGSDAPDESDSNATPFRTWYRETWLFNMPWYSQLPVWLFYGFTWIPCWYFLSATPNGGLKSKWRSLTLAGKSISCFPILLLVVTVFGPGDGANNGGIRGSGDHLSLTEPFIVPVPGTTLKYTEKMYDFTNGGKGNFRIESQHHIQQDGKARVVMTNIFPTMQDTYEVSRSVGRSTRNGQSFVGFDRIEILVGARPGDTWTSKDGSETFKLNSVTGEPGSAEAVIESVTKGTLHTKDDSTVIATTVLREGVGLISQERYWNTGGQRQLGGTITMRQ